MNQIDGQISLTDLFDLMSPQKKTMEPPILLREGQKVYKVIRGDVEECIVTGRSWVCFETNRGYTLKRLGGCWDVVWNDSIGVNLFTDLKEANEKTEKYLIENDCIRAGDIKAKEVFAYKYLYNDREIVSFYAVLEDDTVYYKYGGMYEHIGTMKEMAGFEKDMHNDRKRDGYEEIADYLPVFTNMYKCKNDTWLYAAARYQYFNC